MKLRLATDTHNFVGENVNYLIDYYNFGVVICQSSPLVTQMNDYQ